MLLWVTEMFLVVFQESVNTPTHHPYYSQKRLLPGSEFSEKYLHIFVIFNNTPGMFLFVSYSPRVGCENSFPSCEMLNSERVTFLKLSMFTFSGHMLLLSPHKYKHTH